MMILKKIAVFVLFILCAMKFIFANTYTLECNSDNAVWTTVLGGNILSAPLVTSYGQIVFTEGHIVYALSEKGIVLWKKKMQTEINGNAISTPDNFVYFVSNSNILSFLNQSGLVIWKKQCPFSITGSLLVGEDGRIFAQGNKNIACYGMNGIQKWILKTPEQKNIPICTFNDGSILVFLSDQSTDQTSALRVSPFGSIIEKIKFTGKVSVAASCKDGIIMIFNNGACGFCSVSSDSKSYTRWSKNITDLTIQSSKNNQTFLFPIKDNSIMILCNETSKIKCIILDVKNGDIIKNFDISDISGEIIYSKIFNDGIFLSSQMTASFYDFDGNQVWNATFPSQKSKIKYITYSQQGYLLLYNDSWDIEAFRMNQPITAESNSIIQNNILPYPYFIKTDNTEYYSKMTMGYDFINSTQQKCIKELEQGNYGDKEQKWTKSIQKYTDLYNHSLLVQNNKSNTNSSIFQYNSLETTNLITLMSLFGTNRFTSIYASLLKNENNSILLEKLVFSAGQYGYDPNGKILDALNIIIHDYKNQNNTILLQNIALTIYKICKFMGKPIFFKKGKNILVNLMYPQFNSKIRNYASLMLQNIGKFEMSGEL